MRPSCHGARGRGAQQPSGPGRLRGAASPRSSACAEPAPTNGSSHDPTNRPAHHRLRPVIGLAAQALLLDNLLGVNAPLLATALLGAAFVLRPRDRRMDPLDWWLPPTALAMSAAIALRADPTLLLLDLGPACGLLGASIAALAGEA